VKIKERWKRNWEEEKR